MNSDNKNERRRSKRLEANFTFVYQIDKPLSVRMKLGWDSHIDALMVDLSEHGMAILTDNNIPVDTVLSMKFTLINSELKENDENRVRSMEIVGKVCSNILQEKEEYRLGISFTQIDPQDRLAIANFVKMLSKNKNEGT